MAIPTAYDVFKISRNKIINKINPIWIARFAKMENAEEYADEYLAGELTTYRIQPAEMELPLLKISDVDACSHGLWNGMTEHCPACNKVMLANYANQGRIYKPF